MAAKRRRRRSALHRRHLALSGSVWRERQRPLQCHLEYRLRTWLLKPFGDYKTSTDLLSRDYLKNVKFKCYHAIKVLSLSNIFLLWQKYILLPLLITYLTLTAQFWQLFLLAEPIVFNSNNSEGCNFYRGRIHRKIALIELHHCKSRFPLCFAFFFFFQCAEALLYGWLPS